MPGAILYWKGEGEEEEEEEYGGGHILKGTRAPSEGGVMLGGRVSYCSRPAADEVGGLMSKVPHPPMGLFWAVIDVTAQARRPRMRTARDIVVIA